MLTFGSRAIEWVNTAVIHPDRLSKLLDSNPGRKVATLTDIILVFPQSCRVLLYLKRCHNLLREQFSQLTIRGHTVMPLWRCISQLILCKICHTLISESLAVDTQIRRNFPTFYETRGFITVFIKAPALVPILRQLNLVSTTPSYISKIHFNIMQSRIRHNSGLFPSGFPTNILYTFLSYPFRTTYPAHLAILDLIILIILGEEYKLWSSSLCSFLQPPVTSSFSVQIFSSAPCSQTPSDCVPNLLSRDQVSNHTEPQEHYNILYPTYYIFRQ
jgi:hypothetical protein